MPFGDPKGTQLQLSGNSITASNVLATGSAVVRIGDLVLVNFAQQTSLTATGVTDNLGNTYTAANAGTDAGTVTGRFFYSRVTVAGALTSVTVAATASANNFAGVARVIEGPFSASDLLGGTTPGNVEDVASPFACPSSGTLDVNSPALKKLVVGWAVHDNNANWSATAPNTEVAEILSTGANAIIGVQVVTATTAVAPQFTGTNPIDSVLGTIAFNEQFIEVFQQPPSQPVIRKGLTAAVIAAGLVWSGHTPAPAEPPAEIPVSQIITTVPYQRIVLYQSIQQPTFVAPAEVVTVDKWYQSLSDPVKRLPSRHPEALSFTYFVEGGVSGNDDVQVVHSVTRAHV